MKQTTDPAVLVARIREALRFDQTRAEHVAVRARGSGTVAGLLDWPRRRIAILGAPKE